MKAALHVHTTYSDGELTLPAVRDLFLADGCRVVCLADHAEYFEGVTLGRFVEECASLSDSRITLVPGLEFGCVGRMHIVGYGVTRLVASQDAIEVIGHIASCGGISVIAHPSEDHLRQIRALQQLPDGIEVWNTKYDGPGVPRRSVFDLVQELRAAKPDLLAFYGLDLHWERQPRPLLTEVGAEHAGVDAVIAALRQGRFVGLHGQQRLPSDASVAEPQLADFAIRYARANRIRGIVRRLKRWSGPLGRAVPAPIKSRLRRFL
jgi:hypothetical protein